MNEHHATSLRDGAPRRARRATNPAIVSPPAEDLRILEPFVDAGLLGDTEIQLATALHRLSGSKGIDAPPLVVLAAAVASRGFRSGHVCVDLTVVDELIGDETEVAVPWPDPDEWLTALRSAPDLVSVVAGPTRSSPGAGTPVPPLVLDGSLLYLQRHWLEEVLVAERLLERASGASPLALPPDGIDDALDRFFGPAVVDGEPDWQRQGARTALTRPLSILVGGPGTGKTRTIARMLACLHTSANAAGRRITVAGAAPSGKAAARMAEAIEEAVHQLHDDGLIDQHLADRLRTTPTMTIHRLLGADPRRGFRHDGTNPLTYDMVIVDESSMIDLPLMCALFEALPPACHLVMVGDPDQLASVGAGTVLGDIVRPVTADPSTATEPDPPSGGITVLRRAHRFGSDSAIAALANAVRNGDAERTIEVLGVDRPDIERIDPSDTDRLDQLLDTVTAEAVASVRAAVRGDVDNALEHMTSTKILSALHDHPFGQHYWTARIEDRLFDSVDPHDVRIPWSEWYIGRPVMVTSNDPLLRISNGDTGTTVSRDGITTVVLDGSDENRHEVQAARLDDITTWWAMTIHKSQGSEFDHAVVSLPTVPTRILTRELLYTGVTRARSKVTVIGTEEIITAAVRRPISRASGLQDRLWPALGTIRGGGGT